MFMDILPFIIAMHDFRSASEHVEITHCPLQILLQLVLLPSVSNAHVGESQRAWRKITSFYRTLTYLAFYVCVCLLRTELVTLRGY